MYPTMLYYDNSRTASFTNLCFVRFLLLLKKVIDLKPCQVSTTINHYDTKTNGDKTEQMCSNC